MRISIIIPANNAAEQLKLCLQALAKSNYTPAECIVVDDGSTDETPLVAIAAGVSLASTVTRCGPAKARNLGARMASGDLLVFIDADVALHPDALERMVERFANDQSIDALVGSYDDTPAHPGFVSQFKNLSHSFIHHNGNRRTSVFWCGCGAVKRSVFLEHGGLDESYDEPSIEDIEFGVRMLSASRKIVMDSRVQCTHLKAWTFWKMIRTDVFLRGIPWTQLILRTGSCPNDLNLRWGQRIAAVFSAVLIFLSLLLLAEAISGVILMPFTHAGLGIAASLAAILLINHAFYRFLVFRKGWRFSFSAIPMHILYYFYSAISFTLGLGIYALRHASAPTTQRNLL